MGFGRPKIAKLAERGDVAGLVAALGAKHAEDRWRAASALGHLKAADAADALAAALADPDASVQQSAAISLAQLGDPRATPPLLQLTGDPDPDERFIGAAMVGLLTDKRAFDTLLRLLGDPDGRVREAAVAGLLRFTGAKVTDALVTALDDPARAPAAMAALSRHRAAVKDRALRTIVRGPHPEQRWRGGIPAWKALVASRPATIMALLGDDDASIRAMAAELVRLLGRSVAETDLESAVQALERHGDVEALIRIGQCIEIPSWDRTGEPRWLNDRLSPDLRVRVTAALGRLGDPRAADVVAQQLGPYPSDDAGERRCARAAVEALPQVWSPEHLAEPGQAALRHALTGAGKDTRLTQTLAKIGDATAVGMLLDAVAANRDSRRVVAPALRHVSDAAALVPGLFSRSSEVREMVATAVTHLGAAATPALLDALQGALRRKVAEPARAGEQLAILVDLLGKVGDRRAIEPLLRLLDGTGGLSNQLVLALLGQGRPTITRVLDILLQDAPGADGSFRPRGSPSTFAMLLLEHGKCLDAAQQARAAAGFRAAFQAEGRIRGYGGPTGNLHRLLMWRIKGDEPLLTDVEVHAYAEKLLVRIEEVIAEHRTHWGEVDAWDPLGTVVHDRIGALDDDQLARVIALEPIECEVWGGDEREMGGAFVTLDPEPLRQQAKAEQRRRAKG